MNYTGEKCVLCGQVFGDGDDIVVCPECGSPHHRACYKLENKCANAGIHGQGGRWQRTVPQEPEQQSSDAPEGIRVCPVCGFENEPDSGHCRRCGTPFASAEGSGEDTGSYRDPTGIGIPRPYLGFDPEEDLGGASLRELSHFVDRNTIYYIPIFKRMKDMGTKASFNLLCFIFPPLYFANRRMWFWALLTAVISVLLGIPAAISYLVKDGMETGYQLLGTGAAEMIYSYKELIAALIDICNIGDIIMRTVFCLFGNWIYLRFSVRNLQKLKLRLGTAPSREQASEAGGVRPANMLLIMLIVGALSFAALYAAMVLINVIYFFVQ